MKEQFWEIEQLLGGGNSKNKTIEFHPENWGR